MVLLLMKVLDNLHGGPSVLGSFQHMASDTSVLEFVHSEYTPRSRITDASYNDCSMDYIMVGF